ncbi:hypothetical protein METBIDRAFT_17020, partial [Metschnikowia bicuspidata var. bicuspidata NRRL YB-4993]
YIFISLIYISVSVAARTLQSTVSEPTISPNLAIQSGGILSESISPLEPRVLSDWQLDELIIVSDVDGSLHGLNRKTGASMWTLPIDEPLVHILGSSFKKDTSSNILWFVEPFEDGSLFYFSPEFGLNKLPTSIKNLVMESPFSLNGDDKIYTGARKTSLYTLDKSTGKVTNMFGLQLNSDSCSVSSQYMGINQDISRMSNHIMLGKTTYELSIHSKVDSSIVWNVTYAHWGPNNIDNDLMIQNRDSVDKLYFTPFHDKSLLALNHALGAPAWMSRLPSMAVTVFDVFSHLDNGSSIAIPHPAKEFNQLQHVADGPNSSNFGLCFLNKTAQNSQWYAMSYRNFPTLIKSAPTSPYEMALQKYEKGFLEHLAIEKMRTFNVHEPDAVFFLSGIHSYGSLSSANSYQPGSKFRRDEFQRIGGSPHDLINPSQWSLRDGQAPSLMDGIFFPLAEESSKRDLAVVNSHQDVHRGQKTKNDFLPVTYHKHSSAIDSISTQKLLIFRRISEDLIVMFTLLLFLIAFVKIAQKLKYLSPEHTQIKHWKDESHQSEIKSTEIKVSESQDMLEASSRETVLVAEPNFLDCSDSQQSAGLLQTTTNTQNVFSPGVSVVHDDQKGTSEIPLKVDEDLDDQGLVGTSKKKRKRGSRGGKRGGKLKKLQSDDEESSVPIPSDDASGTITMDEENDRLLEDDAISTLSLVNTFAKPDNQLKKLQIDKNLVISNNILGYGSHGTVVYEGTFENRPVAVKRMLFDFYDIANHEVRLLQESDDHPNVIRYFCSQSNLKEKFLYIALERCVCSLEDLIEKQRFLPQKSKLNITSRNDLLHQLASGLSYLHSLKIVHRDLKPQNILLGETTQRKTHFDILSTRLLISDFGLCKKLDADQSSFGATTHTAASGTSGWRAPELLHPGSNCDISQKFLVSQNRDHINFTSVEIEKRLTKAIDIFSLGCVFFYILTDGCHPFGDRYLREANIIKGSCDLSPLIRGCPRDHVEATHLINLMIHTDPKMRPDTVAILKHPLFWSTGKKLEFLLKVSDRFEIERRDPPSDLLLTLEEISFKVHQGDWLGKFNSNFIENLGKYRKYHTEKVMDLLRALRNKYHHYNDMPTELQSQMSPLPSGFYNYFNEKFPHLLMEVYAVVEKHLQEEHIFHEFF